MKKAYIIGIGGIGASAVAKYLLHRGWQVEGSDMSKSEITENLEKIGVKVKIPQKKENVPEDVDLIIKNPAITEKNVELQRALEIQKKKNIKIKNWQEVLSDVSKEKFTLAVCGTHGKSTTTSMLSIMMVKTKLDPTCIIGTNIKEFGNTNFRSGKSNYFVIEADEYEGNFLNYWPNVVILTSIDKDHLDYFKNLRNIFSNFEKFILKLPKNGVLICNKDSENVMKLANRIKKKRKDIKIIYYSLKDKDSKKIKKVLKVPGSHNVSNALAVFKVGKVLGLKEKDILKSLSVFKGVWRRFDIRKINSKNFGKITIVHDYAHNPQKVKAAIQGVFEKWPNKRIWIVFQPHQRQRTYYLFNDFIKALKEVENLILTEIYDVPGREVDKISAHISSKHLYEKLKKYTDKIWFVKDYKDVPKFLKDKFNKKSDIILIMGAGDIYELEKYL
ncbi:UDP-N-acetylmuramate--L-alanine ligase [bacterium HR34]|nr:UDP-N-acetylmuramate--L-alanine ligase [bacterium HR34]